MTQPQPIGQQMPPAPSPYTSDGAAKRHKSWGERLFDLTTYGGFALVGNELAATAIVGQAGKENLMGRAIRAGGEFFGKIGRPGTLPYIQQRFNYINFAILGGFLMVPFIKKLEDNKGSCVRFADRIIYGRRAETDPDMVRRHEEMDEAPHQTWSSLGKGRALTVAAAYAVDSTVNWENGISARLLKGTSLQNYASFEHLSNHAAEWANGKLVKHRNLTPERAQASLKTLKNGIGLMTLSTALTVLFYASSKLFASKQDAKHKPRQENASAALPPAGEEIAEAAPAAAHAPKTPAGPAPESRIREPRLESRLHSPASEALLQAG